jgi:hypothetical protein
MAERAAELLNGTGWLPPCCAPHNCAADDTGSGLVPGPVMAGSGNRAGHGPRA